MEAQVIKEFTWYYNDEGRVWVIISVLIRDPANQKVWMLEKGREEPIEHDFLKVEELITSGKIKKYLKPKK